MTVNLGGTVFHLSFTFTSLLTVMLLLCDEEIVLLCLGSSLFHEGGHLAFMYALGDVPKRLSLGAFGIRIEREGSLPYKKEALVALGGVIFNSLLCGIGALGYIAFASELCLKLIAVNAFVAGVNSFPVGVLDMGRALECLLFSRFEPDRAIKITNRISCLSVGLFAVLFAVYTAFFGLNFSFFAVTIYLFTVAIIRKWS